MTTSGWSSGWKLWLASWLVISGAIASGESALAQITPDTTLGNENSTVTSTGEVDSINGGATRGANLFHSFGEFNVEEGRAAIFTNPAGIENILTRVTGANPSNIFGTLGVAGGNANLFLINPNGIIFGPNARLDVGGSFVGTTANAIGLTNGDIFSANPQAPLPTRLLNVNPNALLFNQIKVGAIANRSRSDLRGLQVPQSKSLLLLGGDVSLEGGRMFAPGGRVELGGIAGQGTVGLNVDNSNLRLNFPENVARADVSLNNGADVNVRAGGGGSIVVNAQNLNLEAGSQLRAGIDSELGSISSIAGNIEINTLGLINLTSNSTLQDGVGPRSVGKGGDINITTGSLAMSNGAQLRNNTFGQGDAGDVNIIARDTVSFDDSDVGSNGADGAVGKSGNINITTGSLALSNASLLQSTTFGRGDAGSVNINARDTVSFDRGSAALSTVESNAVGNGGSINIMTRSLSLTNGAQLSVSTYGQGDTGKVNINASDTVSFDGVARNRFSSGAFSTVRKGAVGNSNGINITTGSLSVTNGAQLLTGILGQGIAGNVNINARNTISFDGVSSNGFSSGVASAVEAGAIGNGGNINITTGSLSVTNGARLNVGTFAQGDAGNVNINAHDTVSFDGVSSNGFSSGVGSEIGTARSVAVGKKGGDIKITTGSLSVTNGARLSASTFGQGNAGSVNINARNTISFDGVGSNGSSSAVYSAVLQEAIGNGGEISVTTGSLSVTNGAVISATSVGDGAAGNIEVEASSILLDNLAGLVSDTKAGQGNIFLNSQDLVLRRGSNITTNATGTASGGNITIDTGVLAALENSDISANASEAFGGRVIIDVQGIFGTQFREAETSDSDITATSELGDEFSGTVELNTPDTNLNSALVNLPTVPVDSEVGQACTPGSSQANSEFVVTGRGGLPPNPTEALSSDAIQIDWVTLNPKIEDKSSPDVSTNPDAPDSVPIIEAQGWVMDNNGEVVLTASAPTATPHSPWKTSANCHGD